MGTAIGSASSTATSPLLRRLNAQSVLEVLRDSGAATATELMHATGLSRPTVHTVCDRLIKAGWVKETEGRRPEGEGRPGRRNRVYEFNARAGYVLGIDLGASSITVRLSDLSGQKIAEENQHMGYLSYGRVIPGSQRVEQVRRIITSVIGSTGITPTEVLVAAVGVAAPVSPEGLAHHIDYYLQGMSGADLADALARDFPWHVLLENDADLAVIAERWRGMGGGMDDVIALLAGERLGAGIFASGRIIRGHNNAAGEMGFLRLVDQVGDTDGIGNLARIFGAEAVLRADATGDGNNTTRLYKLAAGDPNRVTSEMVFEAAREHDRIATDIVERIAERMARVISVLSTLLNPEAVIVAGAIVASSDLILPALIRHLPTYTRNPPKVLISTLGDHSVVIGATRLAIDHIESELFGSIAL